MTNLALDVVGDDLLVDNSLDVDHIDGAGVDAQD